VLSSRLAAAIASRPTPPPRPVAGAGARRLGAGEGAGPAVSSGRVSNTEDATEEMAD